MAILAPPDWQYSPRDPQMDKGPAPSSSSTASSSTPPAAHLRSHAPPQPPQHPQPYPFQQQPQGSWTPSIAAQPFYPGAFYQNQLQPQPPPPQAYTQSPGPYFDPANAQLAQWAYQQMMFNTQQAQQAQQAQQHQQHHPHDFYQQNQLQQQPFNPFPSGTPPPRPDNAQPPYTAFHPYRRPSRQQSTHSESSGPPPDWRPQPPYGRTDASGSSSSVNSQGRTRTNSNNSNSNSRSTPARSSPSPVPSSSRDVPPPRLPHHRNGSSSSTSSQQQQQQPPSPSSSSSSSHQAPVPAAPPQRPARPSPLSQGTFTAPVASTTRAERRMSRDDSSLSLSSLSLLATNNAKPAGGSGLKGRLRRALSFNAAVALKEEVGGGGPDDDDDADDTEEDRAADDGDDDDASIKASVVNPPGTAAANAKMKPKTPALIASATRKPGAAPTSAPAPVPASASGSGASASSSSTPLSLPVPKKKSRAASLFNSRLNASTDNISLSSTVSSASVMIRKLGSMGRLARRNSLAGITSLFKDKKPKEGDEDGEGSSGKKDGKKKDKDKEKDKDKDKRKGKGGKGEASEASVSHATAELDRGSDWSVPQGEMTGLSPAAKLARQHTLKSNAEAAAKAAAAASRAAEARNGTVNGGGVPTWERNTATRQGSVSPVKRSGVRVGEDGTRVFVEASSSDEEDGDGDYGYGDQEPPAPVQQQQQAWDDEDEEEEWGLSAAGYSEQEHEAWATDVRRSVERVRVPAKGILKYAGTYDQQAYIIEQHLNPNRARSNSYNSSPHPNELGPLARIPSPDPDHIDGLHRHPSHSSQHSTTSTSTTTAPSLPPLAFEGGPSSPMRVGFNDSPQATPTAATFAQAALAAPPPLVQLERAGADDDGLGPAALPTLTHRAATTPSKKLAFASNLSVYDTFSASMYDRRSEPATWSRLTPALAQRIKEELNSYKMEEMEVHAASRIHTQFFV
ncbi:hypothetical protein B0H10DRAFT_2220841 [Mycena sp. CBHHK59/15]|nr:hypothetical protein B0H10DRAFT_2220841 [Mycena sp. CBHHK59/15]